MNRLSPIAHLLPAATALLALAASSAVSSETSEETSTRKTPRFAQHVAEDGALTYRICPLRNGTCRVKGKYAFQGNPDDSVDYGYALYVWLVLGGDSPIVIDAGLEDVDHMNRGAAEVFSEPIRQKPEETSASQLRRFGLSHADIGHVLVTHLHFDHVDEIFKYENATFHIGRKEWEGVTANGARGSWCDGRVLFKLMEPEWRSRIQLVDDREEVLPGIEAFWVGGHTTGSMAYRIRTRYGNAVCTGDTVSLFANLERPVGVFADRSQVSQALEKIRTMADIVLPSHDPRTPELWPPRRKGVPRYRIRAIRVGECDVTNEVTFQDAWGDNTNTRRFLLYVWVIEGGPQPLVVDTGPNPLYVEEFNRSTEKYIPGGIRQKTSENTIVALRNAGVDPTQVSHVIVTHCHADHYDYLSAFPNAHLVVNSRELEDNRNKFPPDVVRAINARPDVVQSVGEAEVVSGVRVVPLGCHTAGSQGVLVETNVGPVLISGDVVYLYENIEEDRPGRSPSPEACREAMEKIRSLADIVLPAHDPLTLERWPGGVIGGLPSRDGARETAPRDRASSPR